MQRRSSYFICLIKRLPLALRLLRLGALFLIPWTSVHYIFGPITYVPACASICHFFATPQAGFGLMATITSGIDSTILQMDDEIFELGSIDHAFVPILTNSLDFPIRPDKLQYLHHRGSQRPELGCVNHG